MLEARKWFKNPEKKAFYRHAIITVGAITAGAWAFIMMIVHCINYYVTLWNAIEPAVRVILIKEVGWITLWGAVTVGIVFGIYKIIEKRNW